MANATSKTTPSSLSRKQLEDLWVQAGGDPRLANTMAGIALAESGGRPTALNTKPPDYSVGLWQINYYGGNYAPRVKKYGPPQNLYDPLANAKAAVDLVGNGSGLTNWSTYTNGTYKSATQYAQSSTVTPSSNPKGLTRDQINKILNDYLNGKISKSQAESQLGGPVTQDPYGGIPGGNLIPDFSKVGKEVLYAVTVAGGGLIMLVGVILVGVDLGISARAGYAKKIAGTGSKVRNQFGTPRDTATDKEVSTAYAEGKRQGEIQRAKSAGRKSGQGKRVNASESKQSQETRKKKERITQRTKNEPGKDIFGAPMEG